MMDNISESKDEPRKETKVETNGRELTSPTSFVNESNYEELLALGDLCLTCKEREKPFISQLKDVKIKLTDVDDDVGETRTRKTSSQTVILEPMDRTLIQDRNSIRLQRLSTSIPKKSKEFTTNIPVVSSLEESNSYEELLNLGKCDACEKPIQEDHQDTNYKDKNEPINYVPVPSDESQATNQRQEIIVTDQRNRDTATVDITSHPMSLSGSVETETAAAANSMSVPEDTETDSLLTDNILNINLNKMDDSNLRNSEKPRDTSTSLINNSEYLSQTMFEGDRLTALTESVLTNDLMTLRISTSSDNLISIDCTKRAQNTVECKIKMTAKAANKENDMKNGTKVPLPHENETLSPDKAICESGCTGTPHSPVTLQGLFDGIEESISINETDEEKAFETNHSNDFSGPSNQPVSNERKSMIDGIQSDPDKNITEQELKMHQIDDEDAKNIQFFPEDTSTVSETYIENASAEFRDAGRNRKISQIELLEGEMFQKHELEQIIIDEQSEPEPIDMLPIPITTTQIEPESISVFDPITTDVLNALVLSEALEIRQVEREEDILKDEKSVHEKDILEVQKVVQEEDILEVQKIVQEEDIFEDEKIVQEEDIFEDEKSMQEEGILEVQKIVQEEGILEVQKSVQEEDIFEDEKRVQEKDILEVQKVLQEEELVETGDTQEIITNPVNVHDLPKSKSVATQTDERFDDEQNNDIKRHHHRRRRTNESGGTDPYEGIKGEGFLGLEYVLPEESVSVVTYYETTSASENEDNVKEEIVEQAQKIKQLVSEKRMGLPQVKSDHILRMVDDIISNHAKSVDNITLRSMGLDKSDKSKNQTKDKTNRQARNMIGIANQSEEILNKLKSTSEYPANIPGGEAAEHLTKMVKKLHCRHRKLRHLAEEIIAKRWKLLKIIEAKDGSNFGESRKGREIKQTKPNTKGAGPHKTNELKTLYTNPLAKLKHASICSGEDAWTENDPLWKAVSKVGQEAVEKCIQSQSTQTKEAKANLMPEQYIKETHKKGLRNNGVWHTPVSSSFSSHSESAAAIFVKNFNEMAVSPNKLHKIFVTKTRSQNFDASRLTNQFVDRWKRQSYFIGILTVVWILSALLHVVYLCGPRLGDNYVTYTMVEAISGMPWLGLTGIYSVVFLGYLLGGMAVIKTASAKEHNETVNEYCRNRKKKFYFWYGLATYFFFVSVIRCGIWYSRMETTEEKIRSTFQTSFYYSQLPRRMLYTQFLFECCGADGPADYPHGALIGWPKSCYGRVENYDEYYTAAPKPFEYGCLMKVYMYSAITMAAICSLCLIIWMLIVVFPVYLYVYELFICLRTHELNPWLEEVKEDRNFFAKWYHRR